MLRDSPGTASGHALARTDFDAARLAATLRRNVEVRHGLTLVLGCPLPPGVLAQIEALRPALDGLAPGRIRWVAPAAWHLTVYGLKRSQSRPLDRGQVDPLVARLGLVLRRALARTPVIRVPLRGATLSAQGELILSAGECPALDGLRSVMGEIPGVDPLKVGANHVTLGQLVRPFGSDAAFRQAMEAIRVLSDCPMQDLVDNKMRLVCYRNRWLEEIAWQEEFRVSG